MKIHIYKSNSTHVGIILPKLLSFNWNNLEFKPDGNGPEYTLLNPLDGKALGIPNVLKDDNSTKAELQGIDIRLWNENKLRNNGRYHSTGEFINSGGKYCKIRINLCLGPEMTINKIVGIMLHELKHYYDLYFDRKLHDINYSSDPSATPINYFFHNVEFLPQVYSLAFSVLYMSDSDLINHLRTAASTPGLKIDDITKDEIPSGLKFAMWDINQYLFNDRLAKYDLKGNVTVLTLEEKTKRVFAFMKILMRVRKKLSLYPELFTREKFEPKLMTWKEIQNREKAASMAEARKARAELKALIKAKDKAEAEENKVAVSK